MAINNYGRYTNNRSYDFGKTMADNIADNLRMDIIQKRIPAGSIITVKEVAERYGVSSMPVRDAFNTLKGENLLEVAPYKHVKVLSIDREYVSNVYQLVAAIEGILVNETIDYGDEGLFSSAERVNELIGALAKNKVDKAVEEFLYLNGKFHQTLYSVCKNTIAMKLYSYYNDTILDSFRVEYPIKPERLEESYMEHVTLLTAIRNKDRKSSIELIKLHNDNAKEDFCKNDID